nr:MAG TPA: hypothetical protein [Caudoviricetes sp.]
MAYPQWWCRSAPWLAYKRTHPPCSLSTRGA